MMPIVEICSVGFCAICMVAAFALSHLFFSIEDDGFWVAGFAVVVVTTVAVSYIFDMYLHLSKYI